MRPEEVLRTLERNAEIMRLARTALPRRGGIWTHRLSAAERAAWRAQLDAARMLRYETPISPRVGQTIYDQAQAAQRVYFASRVRSMSHVMDPIPRGSVRDVYSSLSAGWGASPFGDARTSLAMTEFQRAQRLQEMFARIDAAEEALDAVPDRVAKRVTVLLEEVGFGYALRMKERIIARGLKPFLDLLGQILLEERARRAFRAAVKQSELGPRPRRLLTHGLDHLDEAEYEKAFLQLVVGVEGAFRSLARRRGVTGKPSDAASAALALGIRQEHQLLVSAIYRELNDGRHGEESDAESDCVLALVGLLIWIEQEFRGPATRWLSRRLSEELEAGALSGPEVNSVGPQTHALPGG